MSLLKLLGEIEPRLCGAEDGVDQVLRRRLAVAAGDGDDLRLHLLADERRELAHRPARVLDADQVKVRQRASAAASSTSAATAPPRGGVGEEVVPVEALALDRDEQRERLDQLGVGADAT